MSTSLFPDINVWLASVHIGHPHHGIATAWRAGLPAESTLTVCRLSQLGLLRLLTTPALMGAEVLTQARAWVVYDSLFLSRRVFFAEEPSLIEAHFRTLTKQSESSPKLWADAYLAAFAEQSGMTLVTLDRALARSVPGSILLG